MKKTLKQAEKEHDNIKNKAYKMIYALYDLMHKMPQKGDTPSTCQKVNILCHIQELEYTINGMCIEDFISNN